MTYEEDRAQIVEILGRLLDGQAELKTSLTSEFGGLASHVDGVASHVDGLASQVDGLASHLDGLASHLDGLASHLDGLASRFEGLASRVDELESAQAQLRVDLMDRLDRQQDTLTMMRDDMLVNVGGAESAHTANANTRVEVRKLHEMVFAMQRQISNLQTVVRELQGRP